MTTKLWMGTPKLLVMVSTRVGAPCSIPPTSSEEAIFSSRTGTPLRHMGT